MPDHDCHLRLPYAHARRLWSLSKPDYLRYKYLQDFDEAMIQLFKAENLLDAKPTLLRADEQKNVLIFMRGDYIFAFNFNPSGSFSDYAFPAPAGKWEVFLSSDEARFDGFARTAPGEEHLTLPAPAEGETAAYGARLSLYLPSRTAMVLRKKD